MDNLKGLMNYQSFLLVAGSFFGVGFLCKWIVANHYRRLIHKVDNLDKTSNATLRRIKNKYISLKQVNGEVKDVEAFVSVNFIGDKICKIRTSAIKFLGNVCVMLIALLSVIMSYYLLNSYMGMLILVTGSFMAIALFLVDGICDTAYKRKILMDAVAVNLANDVGVLRRRERDTLLELIPEEKNVDNESVLASVLGDFLS